MTQESDRIAKLSNIRNQGFLRFVLLRGVLGWGLGTAILYSFIMWLKSDTDISSLLPISFVVFPLGGVLWGALMWQIVGGKYKQKNSATDGR